MPKKLYICTNRVCSLGTTEQPGIFSGGITAAQLKVLGKDGKHGPGYCPNCGQKGKPHG